MSAILRVLKIICRSLFYSIPTKRKIFFVKITDKTQDDSFTLIFNCFYTQNRIAPTFDKDQTKKREDLLRAVNA